MDKYYLIVAGAGQTSRANVEALIEDYIYGHGQDVVFVLPYDKKPSQGQIFVTQLAKDKGKEILIFCREDGNFDSVPPASVSFTDTPIESACKEFAKENACGFILVDDETEDTNKILAAFKKSKVPAFDLTEGLMPINFNPKALEETPEPEIPPAEMLDEPEEEEDDVIEEEFLEDIEDEDLAEDALYGLQAIAKLIAREVVAELVKAIEPGSKGSRK